MKVIVELRNINELTADIYTTDGFLIVSHYYFTKLPDEIKDRQEISLNKIIKLKEAGFDSDEILKMNEAKML